MSCEGPGTARIPNLAFFAEQRGTSASLSTLVPAGLDEDYLWLHTFPVYTPLHAAVPGQALQDMLGCNNLGPAPSSRKSRHSERLVFPEATLAQDDRQSPTIQGRTATTPTSPTNSELTISPTQLPLAKSQKCPWPQHLPQEWECDGGKLELNEEPGTLSTS